MNAADMPATEMTTFGAFKIVEEAGELLQVLGKTGPFPSQAHPDGGPPLRRRAEEEVGDLIAAITYFVEANGLNQDLIADRVHERLALYRAWGLTGLDGRVPPVGTST